MNFTLLHQNSQRSLLFSILLVCLSLQVQAKDSLTKFYNGFIPTDPIITVALPPAAPITIPMNDTYTLRVCQSTVVKLEAVSTGVGNLSYQWRDISNDFVISSTAVFEGVLPEGQYAVFVTDDGGTVRSSATIQVCLVNEPPINVSLSTSGSTTLCSTNSTATLTLSAEANNSSTSIYCPDPVFEYQWLKDGNLLSGENQASLTINSLEGNEGQYSVIVSNGCGSANPVSIEVDLVDERPEDVTISSNTGSQFICTGESITLEADADNDVNAYKWFRNGNLIGTTQNISVNTAGSYSVEAINGCGNTMSAPFVVESLSIPTEPVLISAPSSGVGCSNTGVIIAIANLSSNNSLSIIRWSKDGTPVAEYVFPFVEGTNFQAFESGSYTVTLENQCGENTSTIPKIVQIIQEPSFAQIVATPFTALAPNCDPPLTSIDLSLETDGTDLNYEWFYAADGITYASISTDESVSITQTGFYQVNISNTCTPSFVSEPIEITQITDAPITDITLSTSAPNPSCTGTILIQTNNVGGGAIYTWQRNGETLATTTQSSYSATVSGQYQVQISNACGVSNLSNALDLDINLSPSDVQISPSGDILICLDSSPQPVVLQASASGSDLIYTWFRDGNEVGSGSTLTVNASGEYQVSASNACGEATSEPQEIDFQVGPQSDNLSLVANVCQNPIELLVFTAATDASFRWYKRSSSSQILLATTTVPRYEVSQSGTYFVKVSNECLPAGVQSEDVEVISGNTLPLPRIVSAPSTGLDRICQGEALTLQAQISNPNGLTYRWFRDNTLISGEQNSSIEVNQAGVYRVEVFLASNATCSRLSLPYSVFVRPNPTLLISHQGNLAFCEGDSTILRANATSTPVNYSWYKDNVFVQNGLTLTAKEAGEYRLEASYNASVSAYPCDNVISQSITVQTGPRPSPSILREGGLLSALEQGFVYQWNLNGVPIINANSPTYLPLDSGRYSITIRNDIGCIGTSEEVFHAGIYLGTTESIQISPNPSQGNFQIIITSNGIGAFRIYDKMGHVVFEEVEVNKLNSITGYATVRVGGLSPGMYYLKGMIDGKEVTKKIVIQ